MSNSQKEAIEKTNGPCIILAGAGTGKTYTIVEKIKYLIDKEFHQPEKILCLTFSNEATNSLRNRVFEALPTITNQPIIRTFHSFCSDILREHGQQIHINKDFKILLPDDAKIMLHKNLKVPPNLCHKFINEIHTAKDLGISLQDLNNYVEHKFKDKNPTIEDKQLLNLSFQLQTLYTKDGMNKNFKANIQNEILELETTIKLKKLLQTWNAYEKIKALYGFLDYSDLTQNALHLLKKYPNISNSYDYIIVDEFQDTNKLQCDLLTKICPHHNITVVGDINQSIYRFRGAYKDNFRFLQDTFNTSTSDFFTLALSFRSTNTILRVAHKLIKKNYDNPEECFEVTSVNNREGERVCVHELENIKQENQKIIDIIKKESKNYPLNEICVLFRTHQQSRTLKSELERQKIPYSSVTKKSLLKLMPIKITIDFLAILNKIKNKSKGGDHAWWDLLYNLEFPKGDIITVSKFIKSNNEDNCVSIKLLNSNSPLNLSEEGSVKLKLLKKTIKNLLPHLHRPIPDLVLRIYESAGLNGYDPKTSKDKEKTLVLQKFHELTEEFTNVENPSLNEFIHHLDVINTLRIEIESPTLQNEGVRIMTKHATKGLEYKVVIISNLAQKKFPIEMVKLPVIPYELHPDFISQSKRTLNETEQNLKYYLYNNQILEERRLCYVAFTRAKEKLYLTYSRKYGTRNSLPSQFLNEINYKNNNDIIFNNEKLEGTPLFSENDEPTQIRHTSNKNQTPEISYQSSEIIFSPSSLQLFNECQKRYEYRYVYKMPEPVSTSWESIKLGSFAHEVFDRGVKLNVKSERNLIELAKIIQMEDKWNFVNLNEVMPLIKVFFERNSAKYNENSLTEKKLNTTIQYRKFIGVADRIDLKDDGSLEIIDYKTGDSHIKPRYRNWQLGFYAIAAEELGKPKKLILDTLKHPTSIEFEIDENGNATEIHSERTTFNLDEVKMELLEMADKIELAYKNGFKPCPVEKKCEFCEEYVHCF